MSVIIGQTGLGQDVYRIDLHFDGLSASILSYGAILQDLSVDGHPQSLVLGYPDFDSYLTDTNSFGATVGRVANRIAMGAVMIGGHSYQLDLNENGKTHLHGGRDGTGLRVWRVIEHSARHVVLEDILPDGHMGYPGLLRVRTRFSVLAGQTLEVEITATTDALTLCNFAQHSYFNLGKATTIEGHRLEVSADTYLETDASKIPTGQIVDVAGTRFDFRKGLVLEGSDDFDQNLCVSKQQQVLSPAARLVSPDGAIALHLSTTEPGLQVYTGAGISTGGNLGHDGQLYGPYAGIALEAQGWPDAVNHPHFPSTLLHPDAPYRQVSRYKISTA